MQADYFSKTRIQLELPPSTLSYSFQCNLKSAIRIPHSAIVDPVARPPRLSARDPPATARHERAGTPTSTVSRHQFVKYPG